MNNIHSYQDTIDLPDSGGLRHVENYSGSTSSAYDEVSPHMHNSTPGSNDSIYEKNNQSTISSKKSKNSNLSSDDNLNLTVDALEKTLTEDRTTKIKEIITLISNLSDTEKLLLQLQFPLSDLENTTFESSLNMGFNNIDMIGSSTIMEQEEASKWVMSHLEENKSTCLQKQEVYEDYKSYCMTYNIKCLSTADFGKVMRKIFPNVKARRLGARGQSRYCYSGLRNRQETQSPMLKDIGMILESNENVDEYRKRDNNNTSSEVESYSSTSLLNNDLSNVPEYELSPNILIDSALVLLEFIKQVGLSKNIMSLKQAVKHILTNNQVDLRSPYASRLCSVFQQSDNNNKPYVANKYSNDPVFNTIKKEETLISPCSVTPQRSSTASPQNQKRRDMFNSPVPNKIIYCDLPKPQSDNSPIHTPQNLNRTNFTYNQPYYHQSLPPNMISMPHHVPTLPINSLRQDMSPASIINNGVPPKSFVHSTPVKNAPNIEIPQLNSPLLDNNPLTSKKLELNKYLNSTNSISSNLSSAPDNASKLNLYYSSSDRSRSFASTAYNSQEILRTSITSYSNALDFRTVDSPMSMNTDYIHQPNQEFQEFDDIETPKTRFIDEGRTEINFQTSPTHSINNENNYSMSSSNFCSIASPMKNDKPPYLNTPDNSPNRNDPDVEDSSNCSQKSIKRENSLSITKPGSKTMNYPSCFLTNPTQDYLLGIDRNHFFNPHFNINRSSDESNVTSTTSIGYTDPDGHPSTIMRQNFIYNK